MFVVLRRPANAVDGRRPNLGIQPHVVRIVCVVVEVVDQRGIPPVSGRSYAVRGEFHLYGGTVAVDALVIAKKVFVRRKPRKIGQSRVETVEHRRGFDAVVLTCRRREYARDTERETQRDAKCVFHNFLLCYALSGVYYSDLI